MDKRLALKEKCVLQLIDSEKHIRQYVIQKEIGRGGTGIIYDGTYQDSLSAISSDRIVRIKECYPYNVHIDRSEKGVLYTHSDEDGAKFLNIKENFKKTYLKNVELQYKAGLINSTISTLEMYSGNNTYYIVSHYNEGTTYDLIPDEGIQDTIIRIKALATLIKKYHEAGYLHLDLKPENILIIPETKEHVYLFDFDTVIEERDLRNADSSFLSFSNGFSAPEQVQGNIMRIGTHTDIYSIGSILFYKLFHRKVGIREREIRAEFDYDKLEVDRTLYPPSLFNELTVFFQHTLCSAVNNRWKDLTDVICQLELMKSLSDVTQIFLQDNFAWDSFNFIGRTNLLRTLKSSLQSYHVVFLHGIGGIGKTELANKYIYDNKNSYRTKIVAHYNTSIKEMVLDDCSFPIKNFHIDEDEDLDEYFDRKMTALNELLTEEDIIIIDNYDTDDNDLEQILRFKCHFIITSREDYRDYNYCQLEVGPLETPEEALELFTKYNSIQYTSDEREALQDIIEIVDRHTMTVELIAKHLRESGDNPSDLKTQMLEVYGITNLDSVSVKQRKDYYRLNIPVEQHLLTLFNLSSFSIQESGLLQSFSLLGHVRIYKKQFIFWFKCSPEMLNDLIRRGWIKYDDNTSMLSLHPIVRDLIYRYIPLSLEITDVIAHSMSDFLIIEDQNVLQENIKQQLAEQFYERLYAQNHADQSNYGYTRYVIQFYLRYYSKYCMNNELIEYLDPILEYCLEQKDNYLNEIADIFFIAASKYTSILGVFEDYMDYETKAIYPFESDDTYDDEMKYYDHQIQDDLFLIKQTRGTMRKMNVWNAYNTDYYITIEHRVFTYLNYYLDMKKTPGYNEYKKAFNLLYELNNDRKLFYYYVMEEDYGQDQAKQLLNDYTVELYKHMTLSSAYKDYSVEEREKLQDLYAEIYSGVLSEKDEDDSTELATKYHALLTQSYQEENMIISKEKYIEALLIQSEMSYREGKYPEEIEICLEALQIGQKYGVNEGLIEEIKYELAFAYHDNHMFQDRYAIAKDINYAILAERLQHGKNLEEQNEVWSFAAEASFEFYDSAKAVECLDPYVIQCINRIKTDDEICFSDFEDIFTSYIHYLGLSDQNDSMLYWIKEIYKIAIHDFSMENLPLKELGDLARKIFNYTKEKKCLEITLFMGLLYCISRSVIVISFSSRELQNLKTINDRGIETLIKCFSHIAIGRNETTGNEEDAFWDKWDFDELLEIIQELITITKKTLYNSQIKQIADKLIKTHCNNEIVTDQS